MRCMESLVTDNHSYPDYTFGFRIFSRASATSSNATATANPSTAVSLKVTYHYNGAAFPSS